MSLPIRAHGMTRQAFLLSAALTAGAAAGPGVRSAFAQAGGGDTDVLNFALTLELLEARFYEEGLQRVKGLRREYRQVATDIRDNESEHVQVLSSLIGQLGATPVTEPQFDFGDAFSSEDRFLEVSQMLEDTGVAAYNGAAPRIADRQILEAAGTIVQVEARHAAIIRLLRDQPISPGAFDRALSQGAVTRRVDPFLGG
jgi:rubrerythrin